ncbi:MAG: DEAD/DEAH box helicase [Myxococcales bacterium]|nr:DEAD/DEAH box helicase [Myxococcales bacterium]
MNAHDEKNDLNSENNTDTKDTTAQNDSSPADLANAESSETVAAPVEAIAGDTEAAETSDAAIAAVKAEEAVPAETDAAETPEDAEAIAAAKAEKAAAKAKKAAAKAAKKAKKAAAKAAAKAAKTAAKTETPAKVDQPESGPVQDAPVSAEADAAPAADESKAGFAALDLDPRILSALREMGFEKPTPIQSQAIPPLLEGRDMIGRARTGSGKTAAFGLPLLNRVAQGLGRGAVRGLVLAPTRELALQVSEALRALAVNLNLPIVTVYGGSSYGPQLKALRQGVPIVVGTPGRLIDLLDKGALSLADVEMVVLDEADEMLRMGFVDDVERMLAETPQKRQVALFSATMPREIRRVADKHLREPAIIEAEGGKPSVDHISQTWLRVPQRFKAEALLRILQAETTGAALVFARTKAGCDQIASHLRRCGMSVDALHGDLNQAAREQVVARLRDQQTRFVVATDVAARGIDVQHITLVVNLDIPDNAEVYTHRIGRTGRAGREGRALTLVTPNEGGRYRGMMRRLKVQPDHAKLPTEADVLKRQLDAVSAELTAAMDDSVAATAWLGRLMEDGEQTAEAIAAAALKLLSNERGIGLVESPSDRLPEWARPRQERDFRGREDRYQDRDHRGQERFQKRDRHAGDKDHIDLFLPIGRMHRIRPGDLVGAIANEAGVSGSAIGRITVRDRVSFVSMPRAIAERVVAERETIELRGMQVPVMIARPSGGQGQGQGQGPRGGGQGPSHRDGQQNRGGWPGQRDRGNDRRGGGHQGGGGQHGGHGRRGQQGDADRPYRQKGDRDGDRSQNRDQGRSDNRDQGRPYDQNRDKNQGQRGGDRPSHPANRNTPSHGNNPRGGPPRWTSRRAPGDRPFKRRKPPR